MRSSDFIGKSFAAAFALLAAGFWAAPAAVADEADKVLRVCADPNNLPFSSRTGAGYENKIAEMFAEELGWKLEYTWYPQRMGFIRNSLRSFDRMIGRYKCDLVMGVPVGFELALTTKAYYRSVYALAYARDRGLDGIARPEDLLKLDRAKLRSLKIGVVIQTPPVDWLIENKLFDQAVSYQRQTGDAEQYPGEIVEKDLVAAKIDAAMIWGPIAGYFARQARAAQLVVIPFDTRPDIKFDFDIAMGVRFGERAWRDQVQQLIDRNRSKIHAILADYGVPLLDERQQ
jgi:quinoprotein dehydrogenase-associated probable ABC transporter substrate-binding protein